MFQAFCGAAAVICLTLGLLAPEALAWLEDPEYARAGPLVLLMAPAVLLVEMYIFAPGFWVSKRTGLQAAVSGAAAAFAFVVAYLLIGEFGLTGAAVASLGSGLLFFASWWLVSRRFYPIPVRWGRLAVFLAFTGGAAAAAVELAEAGTTGGVAIKLAAIAFAALLAVLTGLVPWRDGVVAALQHLRHGRSPSPAGRS